MAVAGIGVDIVEIARMQKIMEQTPHFIQSVFTEEEIRYCEHKANPAQHYAGRFAAREAVLKALGTGFSKGVGRRDVSVKNVKGGRPEVVLAGRAAEIAREQDVLEVHLSMSFTHDVAVANAVAVVAQAVPHLQVKVDEKAEILKSFREAKSILAELEHEQDDELKGDE